MMNDMLDDKEISFWESWRLLNDFMVTLDVNNILSRVA